MDLRELESYRLSDAVKFNDRLNPKIWGPDEQMLPEVREKLLAIADDFRESLGIDVEVQDITVSGSNAAYTYTDHSDIDLHLVADLPRADESDVYRELFDAKKYQYNDSHDFKIGGYDVELYVQNANEPHVSQGIYSVKNDEWVKVPSRRKPEVNDISVKSKYEDIGQRVEQAIESGDLARMDAIAGKIREMRQAGLETTGEFGPENLAFKILRGNGTLQKLRDARLAAKSREMSLQERKKKSKKKTRYGFGGYWYPGYEYFGQGGESAGDAGGESIKESSEPRDTETTLRKFIEFTAQQVGIESMPKIRFKRDPAWSQRNNTFGRYVPEEDTLYVSLANRHILDIMRTVAHELTHHRQNEIAPMPDESGETGSAWENEANAAAGIIMRRFSDLYPDLFQEINLNEVDTAQEPQPGRPIDWPEGTVHVKVSDVYDWYKIGQKISDLEHARPTEFGRGVPETILVFSNEPQEEEMVDQLGRLGLSVHDVDPGEHPGEEVDEGMREKIGAVAAAACIAGTPGCATTGADAAKTVQTIGRTAQTVKGIKGSDAREELTTAVKNALRKGTGTRESRVAESSGYIPTEREKNDPRFSMALTVDVHPGQTGKEANKLGLKTDSQGRPELLMKRLGNLLESVKRGEDVVAEDQDLFEVKMSPGELRKWAESPEAQGIQAGFEAELIFRDTARENEEESEPDYDQDQRSRSIDDIIDFFQGGDNGIAPGTARRLRERLWEEFNDWMSNIFYEDVFTQRRFIEWVDENIWPDVDNEYRERAAEELGLDLEEELTPEQIDEIEERAVELFRTDAERDWDNNDRWYSQASEELYDEYRDETGEQDWLESAGYDYMTDVANAFELDWPYWTEGSSYSDGRDPEEIGSSLSRALGGAEVKVSSGYHGVSRRPGRWIIEPDGSLDPDEYEDAGLEVVSPPMPLPQALKSLRKVIDWANGPGDAYTNKSTGLHMGISLPHTGGDVDYVKLILFMGDQYVLEKFGRAANSYCRSALEKLRNVQRQRRPKIDEADVKNLTGAEKTAAAMDLMRKNLVELAARFVQDGVGRDKYTSAHLKDGYIEFRSPGGNYLEMDEGDETALANTMLRFARAMYLAGKPNLERREYSKKLYKLLSGFRGVEISKSGQDTKFKTKVEHEDQSDALELFAKYSTGQINAEELKKQWARQVLAKEQPQPADSDSREYEVVIEKPGQEEVVDTFRAPNDVDADAQFRSRYRDDPRWFQMDLRQKATPSEPQPEKKLSRRAEIAKKIASRPTVWHVEIAETGQVLLTAAQTAEAAKLQARRRDPKFDQSDASLLVKPATAAEVRQYLEQQQDQQQDSQDVEQRVTGTDDGTRRYRVTWTEFRNGQETPDSMNYEGPSAESVVASVRRALEYQGRSPANMQAVLAGSSQDLAQQRAVAPQSTGSAQQREYQIYNRSTGQPAVAFMAASDEDALSRLEQYRQQHPAIDVGVRTGGVTSATRNQLPQGEFTGRWQIKDAQGRVLHTFGGIGNSQADANRFAAGWLGRNRPDLAGQEVEVTPEMNQ